MRACHSTLGSVSPWQAPKLARALPALLVGTIAVVAALPLQALGEALWWLLTALRWLLTPLWWPLPPWASTPFVTLTLTLTPTLRRDPNQVLFDWNRVAGPQFMGEVRAAARSLRPP